jgi:hypothetical protein
MNHLLRLVVMEVNLLLSGELIYEPFIKVG